MSYCGLEIAVVRNGIQDGAVCSSKKARLVSQLLCPQASYEKAALEDVFSSLSGFKRWTNNQTVRTSTTQFGLLDGK